jgi:heme exporter protein B
MGAVADSPGAGRLIDTRKSTIDMSWSREAIVLFRKDLVAEIRTKTALCTVGLFTASALFLVSLSTAALTSKMVEDPFTHVSQPAWDSASKLGLMWVLLCFASFAGLSHTFVHEEETGTVTALRLHASAGGVFAGKLLFNLCLVSAVALLLTPAYMMITGMQMGSPGVFFSVMAAGCLGLGGASTIVGALAAKARGSAALYSAIGLPLMTVFLMLLMNAAATVYIVNPPIVRVARDVGGLVSYGVLIVSMSALTFGYVWED